MKYKTPTNKASKEAAIMAPLAGLLIEYFVVGAVASVWLGPLFLQAISINIIQSKLTLPKELIAIIASTIIPALYLVGMVCDLLGYKLLHERKKEIEGKVRCEANLGDFSAQNVHALATAYEPELKNEIEHRSTRDRIARGSLVASIPMLWYSPFEVFGRIIATSIAVIVIVSLYLLWVRMQTLSAKYEVQVIRTLRGKHKVTVTKREDSSHGPKDDKKLEEEICYLLQKLPQLEEKIQELEAQVMTKHPGQPRNSSR